jgi:flagellar biosynthesis protein FliQ
MSQQEVIAIGIQSSFLALKIAAPALLSIMVTGIVVSILQAATQINEQTLSFIPKIVAMTAALFISAPWILKTVVFFTTSLYGNIPDVTR